jgi:phosphonoacetaldehyde hydrolase
MDTQGSSGSPGSSNIKLVIFHWTGTLLQIEGAADAVANLREAHITVAAVSRCNQRAALQIHEYARHQGLEADFNLCLDDVPEGSPASAMLSACMKALRVECPRDVLVVGETPADIACARELGCPNAGVASIGNQVGHKRSSWQRSGSPNPAADAALEHAHRRLRDAGADFVIDTLYELPLVIRRIAERAQSSAA